MLHHSLLGPSKFSISLGTALPVLRIRIMLQKGAICEVSGIYYDWNYKLPIFCLYNFKLSKNKMFRLVCVIRWKIHTRLIRPNWSTFPV